MSNVVQTVYQRLLDAYGPQHWWPAETPLEVLVGAVLVQNTNWNNVERAIDRLRRAGRLEFDALAQLTQEELEELIRPAGTYRVKAQRLRNLLGWLAERFGGSLEALAELSIDEARRELLAVRGIGPETADSILLYAAGLPTFVVDAYTYRVFTRHGWLDFDADYATIQDYFQWNLPADSAVFNEYHALLVRVGKDYCRKQPLCSNCPLAELLPPSGPCLPE